VGSPVPAASAGRPAAVAPHRRLPSHHHATAKLAALDRRAANLRASQLHTLTSRLARRYGTVVVEDLDVRAMGRGMGRRAFRRTVYQAGIGKVRPMLAYKCPAAGGRLVAADRWYASSKTHHGCGGYNTDLQLGDRVWRCPRCGQLVDRNANAALNLRDWTGAVAVDGDVDGERAVQRGGVAAPVPFVGDHGGQARAQARACEVLQDHREVAGADDTRTKPPAMEGRNPQQGYQPASPHKRSLNW
jgi:putative transposase